MTEALTKSEANRLDLLESQIKTGLSTFIDVGTALAEIRDARLYRESHGTFEEYCREKWGMNPRYANRVIGAALVAENLGPMGPTTERQARELAPLLAAAWLCRVCRVCRVSGEIQKDIAGPCMPRTGGAVSVCRVCRVSGELQKSRCRAAPPGYMRE